MPLQATSGAASYDGFGGGVPYVPTYIEDVFSTYLYTGTGSSQTITNGIDLAGKGGLVWIKQRNGTGNNTLFDTARGTNLRLRSDTTGAQANLSPNGVTSFDSSGFSLAGTSSDYNGSSEPLVSWTFRKQPKFFDVVTWTGNNVNGRQISHNLGSTPGCIIVKSSSLDGTDWVVHHRSLGFSQVVYLNSTVAAETTSRITAATSTTFTISDASTLNSGSSTYVAYLFAHDAGGFGLTGTDNVISCGSYTGNDSANGPTITLGFEPQWLLIKRATGTTANWVLIDNVRGAPVIDTTSVLNPNLSNAESTASNLLQINSTGFKISNGDASINALNDTYIYVAIRRGPMKTPTSGTDVFQPTVYTGTNVNNRLVNTTIAPDMVFVRQRNDTVLTGMVVGDRLRGQPYLLTGSTAAEVNDSNSFDAQSVSAVEYGTAFSAMNGFWCGNDATAKLNASTTTSNHIAEAFKRAPGFFDVVCYTGTGSATTFSHNLGVVPELMIMKIRSSGFARGWNVRSPTSTPTNDIVVKLNTSSAATDEPLWDDVAPTSTVFTVSADANVNASGETYVAYLFASCPGVSKVGSYTGNGGSANTNGTSKTIDCGFSAGARFVLIKRTDDTGGWYVFDSARGIVAASDPHLLLNNASAEATTVDAVDTDNSGFIVNQTSGTNLNVTSATYIFLAIA